MARLPSDDTRPTAWFWFFLSATSPTLCPWPLGTTSSVWGCPRTAALPSSSMKVTTRGRERSRWHGVVTDDVGAGVGAGARGDEAAPRSCRRCQPAQSSPPGASTSGARACAGGRARAPPRLCAPGIGIRGAAVGLHAAGALLPAVQARRASPRPRRPSVTACWPLSRPAGGEALLVSLLCRSVLHHFHFKGSVHSVCFSPDGRYGAQAGPRPRVLPRRAARRRPLPSPAPGAVTELWLQSYSEERVVWAGSRPREESLFPGCSPLADAVVPWGGPRCWPRARPVPLRNPLERRPAPRGAVAQDPRLPCGCTRLSELILALVTGQWGLCSGERCGGARRVCLVLP